MTVAYNPVPGASPPSNYKAPSPGATPQPAKAPGDSYVGGPAGGTSGHSPGRLHKIKRYLERLSAQDLERLAAKQFAPIQELTIGLSAADQATVQNMLVQKLEAAGVALPGAGGPGGAEADQEIAPGVTLGEIAPQTAWDAVQIRLPKSQDEIKAILRENWDQRAETEGDQILPGKPPGQAVIDWHEGSVNHLINFGMDVGALPHEIKHDAAVTARNLLGYAPGETPGGGPRPLAEEAVFGAVLMRIPEERVNPYQLKSALKFVAKAKDGAEQARRLTQTIEGMQVLDKAGSPPVTDTMLEQWLYQKHDVPFVAMRMSPQELREKHDEIAFIQSAPGHHEVGLSKHRTFKIDNDEQGNTTHVEVHKKSGWSRFKEKSIKWAGIAFTIMSFIPPVAWIGMIGNAAISLYQGYKNKDWVGGIVGAAASFAGAGAAGVAGAATKAAQTMATVGKYAAVAGGLMDAYAAKKRGDSAGFWGGVAGSVATAFGGKLNRVGEKATTMSQKIGDWAARAAAAADGYKAAKNGDYLGAASVGLRIAASLDATGEKVDAKLLKTADGFDRYLNPALAAARNEDYFGAASGIAGFLSSYGGKNQKAWENTAIALQALGYSKEAIEHKQWGAAAAGIAGAAARWRETYENRRDAKAGETGVSTPDAADTDSETRKKMEVSDLLDHLSKGLNYLDSGYQLLKEHRYKEGAASLRGASADYLAGNSIGRSVERQAQIVDQIVSVAERLEAGDYERGGVELNYLATMLTGAGLDDLKAELEGAARYFVEVGRAGQEPSAEAEQRLSMALEAMFKAWAPEVQQAA